MLIFATIFGVGFLALIISLVFGHDTDFHADADVADVDTDSHGPSVFSVKMMSMLMVGFGAVAFGVRATTDASMFASSMAGVGGGAIMTVIGYIIIRLFYSSQTSSTISDEDIIGSEARLMDATDGKEYGQVACVIRGREITFLARSYDGTPIARNVPVRIMSKAGGIVTVQPIQR